MARRKPNKLRQPSKSKDKQGDRIDNSEYIRPKKPSNITFGKTVKEDRLEALKKASKRHKRNPDDQTINWESIEGHTHKVQPLGGVFQNKTVIKKTSVYAPMSIRRFNRFSKD